MAEPALSGTIDIPLLGIEVTHTPEFCVDRTAGNGRYVFVYFHGPIYLRGVTGTRRLPRGGAVLYGPRSRYWYGGIDTEMRHSWFHCSGAGMAECIQRFHLPVDQAFAMSGFGSVVPFLHDIRREQLRKEPYWEEAVSARAVSFFLEYARAVKQAGDTRVTPYEMEVRETLRHVREMVHSDLSRAWTVEEMADLAHLSASRFTALYSRFFESSPLHDLIDTRIRQACSLLQQTAVPVERIASDCGFGSAAHFSRLFRKRIGCAPSRYRRPAHL